MTVSDVPVGATFRMLSKANFPLLTYHCSCVWAMTANGPEIIVPNLHPDSSLHVSFPGPNDRVQDVDFLAGALEQRFGEHDEV